MGEHPKCDSHVADLVERMTLEEKIAQIGTVRIGTVLEDGEFAARKAEDVLGDGIGRVTRVGRESHLPPEALAEAVDDIQQFVREETRLGIPAIVREESLCGYAGRGGSVFPQSIGLASTWNPQLVTRVAATTAEQLSAIGIDLTLSPVADLGRDPRWGRTEETYGEDPSLAAAMTAAYVEGLQDAGDETVHATLKHFVGHGGGEGGRNRASVDVSPRKLREGACVPFEAGIRQADAASVMAAYHDIDGIPCHASHSLLTRLLREEWGFDGTVVSDGRGIDLLQSKQGVAADRQEAAAIAINAGIDIELPERECFGDPLVAAVADGDVEERRVEQAVSRHLQQKETLGLLDTPPADSHDLGVFESTGPATGAHARSVAREAATESLVLLQNDGLLPLDEKTDSLAVLGPNADAPRHLLGNYAYAAAESRDSGVEVVTPLDGVREVVPDEATISHVRGCDVRDRSDHEIDEAVRAADDAEIAVLCLGGSSGIGVERETSATSGGGLGRADLGLSGRQDELVRAVHETGTPVVVVLVNGRPLATEWIAENVGAVVEAWLPGEEGGQAIADVLFGRETPGGRLPVSIPRSVGQLPVHYDRKPPSADHEYVFGDAEPLYPFGHGESYTEFRYRELSITPSSVTAGDRVTVEVTVENVGNRPGAAVPQVYARDVVASRIRPARQLVGFERVQLAPGEAKTVAFAVPTEQLALYDRELTPVIEPGTVEIRVGASAAKTALAGEFDIVGERQVDTRAKFTETSVR